MCVQQICPNIVREQQLARQARRSTSKERLAAAHPQQQQRKRSLSRERKLSTSRSRLIEQDNLDIERYARMAGEPPPTTTEDPAADSESSDSDRRHRHHYRDGPRSLPSASTAAALGGELAAGLSASSVDVANRDGGAYAHEADRLKSVSLTDLGPTALLAAGSLERRRHYLDPSEDDGDRSRLDRRQPESADGSSLEAERRRPPPSHADPSVATPTHSNRGQVRLLLIMSLWS